MVVFRGFDTEKDIPDLAGKVILVTGGTGGVGKEALLHLTKHNPKRIFFTGRNATSAESLTTAHSNLTFLPCDHSSLTSIRTAAASLISQTDRLDIFIANAGIMAVPPGLTTDGYEIQFGTNHIGNAALTLLLLPLMLATSKEENSDVRFVSLSSDAYNLHPGCGICFDSLKTTLPYMLLGTWSRYGQSKLANLLFANELAKRYPSITSLAIHPGAVETELITELGFLHRMVARIANLGGMLTPEQGCINTLWAATGRDVRETVKSGEGVAFFDPVGKGNAGDATCHKEELMKKLWEWTETEVGVTAPVE